jgi:CYTH domain
MKEDSDNVERELKFARPSSDEGVLELLRGLMKSQKLVKWPPRTVLDIYFDSDDLALDRSNATLRFRKRKKNPGWTVNFKPPPFDDKRFMARREIRTSVTIEEALDFERQILGKGGALAHQVIGDSRGARLRPVVHTVSNRRCYTVKFGELEDPGSNFLNVILEEVTAMDVRSVDVRPLIRSGFLDYQRPIPETRFVHDEIEADGRSDSATEEAVAMMVQLGQLVRDAGLGAPQISKYKTSLRLLNITAG